MKNFTKTLRTIIGKTWVVIRRTAMVAGFFWLGTLILSAIMLASLATPKDTSIEIKDNTVLYFDLDFTLHDGGIDHKSLLPGLSLPWDHATPTADFIVNKINSAAADDRISGLVFRLTTIEQPLLQAEKVHHALLKFRQSGKTIYAYSDSIGGMANGLSAGTTSYYMLSPANEMWVHPLGSIGFYGASIEQPYLASFLEKIGAEAELLQQGRYKNSFEMFTRSNMSPEQKETSIRLISAINSRLISDIALARSRDTKTVKEWMKEGFVPTDVALLNGMIDGMGDLNELLGSLEKRYATPHDEFVPLALYQPQSKTSSENDQKTRTVADIRISGPIVAKSELPANNNSFGTVSANMIAAYILDAAESEEFEAILLTVNSPGGTPVGSDIIHSAIIDAKKSKPVVVMMTDVAASGGYWLATAADYIVASPYTLTGSIGVFMGKPNLKATFEKLGINWEKVSLSSVNTDANDGLTLHEPLSKSMRNKLTRNLEHVYETFLKRVSEGRDMSLDAVEEIAAGQVWTGSEAYNNGLVDFLGGKDTTKKLFSSLLHTDEASNIDIVTFPATPPLWQLWLSSFTNSISNFTSVVTWINHVTGFNLEASASLNTYDHRVLSISNP